MLSLGSASSAQLFTSAHSSSELEFLLGCLLPSHCGLFSPWEVRSHPPSKGRKVPVGTEFSLAVPPKTQVNLHTSSANLDVWAQFQVKIYTFSVYRSIFTYEGQRVNLHPWIKALWVLLHDRNCRWLFEVVCFNWFILFWFNSERE